MVGDLRFSVRIDVVMHRVCIVLSIHRGAQGDLTQIAQTDGLISLLLSTRKGWQEQTSEDRDDCDDHQQLNESESARLLLERQTTT